MKNVSNIMSQAIPDIFKPAPEIRSVSVEVWEKLITPKITGYEMDGQIIIIHTDRPDEYSFEVSAGSGRFDLLRFIQDEYDINSIDKAENYLDGLDAKGRNEIAEAYALEYTDRWEVVGP